MGRIGEFLGGKAGGFLGGRLAGATLGQHHGKCGKQLGEASGAALGSLLPFKKGGRVRKTGKAIVHKGEYILPRGVPPTKKQVMMVRKRGGRT